MQFYAYKSLVALLGLASLAGFGSCRGWYHETYPATIDVPISNERIVYPTTGCRAVINQHMQKYFKNALGLPVIPADLAKYPDYWQFHKDMEANGQDTAKLNEIYMKRIKEAQAKRDNQMAAAQEKAYQKSQQGRYLVMDVDWLEPPGPNIGGMILSGLTLTTFPIWDNSRLQLNVTELQDGEIKDTYTYQQGYFYMVSWWWGIFAAPFTDSVPTYKPLNTDETGIQNQMCTDMIRQFISDYRQGANKQ
ncbi:MAG: hypothetical protein KDK39_17040 [Leptospiraceae bacterium]|nr:hypothetical protein [Leptospiraceae bacterium]